MNECVFHQSVPTAAVFFPACPASTFTAVEILPLTASASEQLRHTGLEFSALLKGNSTIHFTLPDFPLMIRDSCARVCGCVCAVHHISDHLLSALWKDSGALGLRYNKVTLASSLPLSSPPPATPCDIWQRFPSEPLYLQVASRARSIRGNVSDGPACPL